MSDIDTLIRELEKAPEGSRELDWEIHVVLGGKRGQKGFKNNKWKFQRWGPHYTTSLDAALPWENIVSVTWEGGDCWAATHMDSATAKQTFGNACTEVLARRVAALKAKRAS